MVSISDLRERIDELEYELREMREQAHRARIDAIEDCASWLDEQGLEDVADKMMEEMK